MFHTTYCEIVSEIVFSYSDKTILFKAIAKSLMCKFEY